jgi:hypothetical protein
MMTAPSKQTMVEFREWLVGWTLRTIADAFNAQGFVPANLDDSALPGGQRRNLVECFYANIDLKNPDHVRRLIAVYEEILFVAPAEFEQGKQKLIRRLERDGFEFKDGRIRGLRQAIEVIPKVGLDTEHLDVYLERIKNSVESDPELAIGSAKDLLEGTLKSILSGLKQTGYERDEIPVLLKKAQLGLELAPDQVDGSRKGVETIKRTLSNLGSIVVGVFELRNLYGSGHGQSKRRTVDPRLARLVVGAAGTLCRFLLETYEARNRA